MTTIYNVYCDESCHLEHDGINVMVLGAVSCPLEETRRISEDIRSIKLKHNLSPKFEMKWTKTSPGKINFYLDIIDYFFGNYNISFRAVVISDKSKLRHQDFQQHHDDWYYKMYFTLLKVILDPKCKYRIYLDIKDTKSMIKIGRLHRILCYSLYDFNRDIIEKIQPVHSHEVEQIQLADLLIGTVCYINRGLSSSQAKTALVERVKEHTGYSLIKRTLLGEKKFNIFIWQAQEDNQ